MAKATSREERLENWRRASVGVLIVGAVLIVIGIALITSTNVDLTIREIVGGVGFGVFFVGGIIWITKYFMPIKHGR